MLKTIEHGPGRSVDEPVHELLRMEFYVPGQLVAAKLVFVIEFALAVLTAPGHNQHHPARRPSAVDGRRSRVFQDVDACDGVDKHVVPGRKAAGDVKRVRTGVNRPDAPHPNLRPDAGRSAHLRHLPPGQFPHQRLTERRGRRV